MAYSPTACGLVALLVATSAATMADAFGGLQMSLITASQLERQYTQPLMADSDLYQCCCICLQAVSQDKRPCCVTRAHASRTVGQSLGKHSRAGPAANPGLTLQEAHQHAFLARAHSHHLATSLLIPASQAVALGPDGLWALMDRQLPQTVRRAVCVCGANCTDPTAGPPATLPACAA